MVTKLTIFANSGVTAAQDVSYDANPAMYVQLDLNADRLIWSDGSTRVTDGSGSPTNTQLNEAAPLITTTDYEIPKLFLDDVSANGGLGRLTLIGRAGSVGVGSGRYVLCFRFDKDTATEPQLEAWDNSSHSSYNSLVLGSGLPASSWFSAITTTNMAPYSVWRAGGSGTKLAGSGLTTGTGRLLLNDGNGCIAASGGNLYCNLAVVVPANYPAAVSESGVLTVRYTYN